MATKFMLSAALGRPRYARSDVSDARCYGSRVFTATAGDGRTSIRASASPLPKGGYDGYNEAYRVLKRHPESDSKGSPTQTLS